MGTEITECFYFYFPYVFILIELLLSSFFPLSLEVLTTTGCWKILGRGWSYFALIVLGNEILNSIQFPPCFTSSEGAQFHLCAVQCLGFRGGRSQGIFAGLISHGFRSLSQWLVLPFRSHTPAVGLPHPSGALVLRKPHMHPWVPFSVCRWGVLIPRLLSVTENRCWSGSAGCWKYQGCPCSRVALQSCVLLVLQSMTGTDFVCCSQ